MNKFIRQNLGGGLVLKNFISAFLDTKLVVLALPEAYRMNTSV